jgi:Fic family protein
MERFEQVYGNIGKTESIISTAAVHHRLLWIHPFMDGNGRVARLMSHAMMLDLLDTGAVWSVARGLARNVQEYKRLLANCDQPRRNDLDGRGALSEEALAEFTQFFLTVCIDQVNFMESRIQPDRLRARILLWAEEEIRLGRLPLKSGGILEAVLYRGELPRGDADTVVGTGERQARRLLSKEVLVSDSSRAPLRSRLPRRSGCTLDAGVVSGEARLNSGMPPANRSR